MIEARNLTKTYGTVRALKGVSFTLESGKVYGLLGVNGAGKTTTLQLLSGYLTPTSGEVLVDGISMAKHPVEARSRIGYLPEVPPLYPELTVEEYLRFQAELRQIKKGERDAAVREAIRVGRLSSVRRRLIGQLSKGFRQRVGLAAVLMGDPDILLLDEPTNGLDPVQMVEMRRLIRELGKERTVVVSSHVLSEITKEADELLIIAAGRLVLAGPQESLTEGEGVLEVKLKDNAETRRKLEGLNVLSMEHRASDLEDLFLRVTEEAYREERSEEDEEEEDGYDD
jgi:ABC-2 type transport system ATP-binding protein